MTTNENQVSIAHAAEYLGCSEQAVMINVKKGKLKAQKVDGSWCIEKKDLEQAKATKLIKPRKSNPKKKLTPKEKHMVVNSALKRPESNMTEIKIEIDKDKLSLIAHALKHSNKTVLAYITETLDSLHGRVSESIKSVQI
jgi:excisionase family DNA binding protein